MKSILPKLIMICMFSLSASCKSVPITMMKLRPPVLTDDQVTYAIPNSEKTIEKGKYYTHLEDVAAYVMAFKGLPDNYVLLTQSSDRILCSRMYAENCRLYKYPYHNDNTGKYNSPYLTDGATDYYEADLSDPSSGTYDPNSRGEFRIIFSVQEGHEILYYTDDHYDHMSEYFNYYTGWGPWFGDNKSEKHNFSKKWNPGVVVESIDFEKLNSAK